MTETNNIPESQKKFFETRIKGFIGQMLSITREIIPHDTDQHNREKSHIQDAQSSVNDFFLNTVGSAIILVNKEHHLLASPSKKGGVVTLQWEDKTGMLLNIHTPSLPIMPETGNPLEWIKKNLKLSYRGEIKVKLEKEKTQEPQ